MHPTARTCVLVAVLLWVVAIALLALAPVTYQLVPGWLGTSIDAAVSFVQLASIPTGAALIGAAVVVQTLAGGGPAPGGGRSSRPTRRGAAGGRSAGATVDAGPVPASANVVPVGGVPGAPAAPSAVSASAVPFAPASAVLPAAAPGPTSGAQRSSAPRL